MENITHSHILEIELDTSATPLNRKSLTQVSDTLKSALCLFHLVKIVVNVAVYAKKNTKVAMNASFCSAPAVSLNVIIIICVLLTPDHYLGEPACQEEHSA